MSTEYPKHKFCGRISEISALFGWKKPLIWSYGEGIVAWSINSFSSYLHTGEFHMKLSHVHLYTCLCFISKVQNWVGTFLWWGYLSYSKLNPKILPYLLISLQRPVWVTSVDPDQMHVPWHLIKVCTICLLIWSFETSGSKMDLYLTLVLLNPGISCLYKQCRCRSVGFYRSQLIWICTVCHSVCEFVSITWTK